MDKSRYIRQTALDKIGVIGQQKLMDSTIAVVGCGGLGSIAAPYLAGAGVGHLILIDGDIPDVSNLHRQVFFSEKKTEKTKSTLLSEHISSLNSQIKITTYDTMISKQNISELLEGADIVLECTDNVQAKYLVNDYCHMKHIPVAYGAIYKYDGYVSLFENMDDGSIHLRDVFPIPNDDVPSCSDVGVLGTLAGLIGLLQANEAIKHITKAGETLTGSLLSYDILTNNQMKLKLKKTWQLDILSVFESSDYIMGTHCDVTEISISDLLANRDQYELISILENEEHRSIDEWVVRQPLSKMALDSWLPISEKPHVFYCMTGKRSLQLITRLQSDNIKLISLKGGLTEFDNIIN